MLSGSGLGNQSQSSANTSGSSGNDPPRDNFRLPREHEIDNDYNDYDEDVKQDDSNPIIGVELGNCGRVEWLWGQIRFHHLRNGPRRRYTERVERFVNRLGRIKGTPKVRDGHEVGHIIGDCLGGPNDKTYNFFPQSPWVNMQQYHEVEKQIQKYLKSQKQAGNEDTAYVNVYVTFEYIKWTCEKNYQDFPEDWPPNCPISIQIKSEYSDGRVEDHTFKYPNT